MTRAARAAVDLHVDDGGFVRAPAARCHRVLCEVAAWPRFWPTTVVTAHGEDRFTLVAGGPGRRLRLAATAGRWRPDAGFTLVVAGDLRGRWEIWLEPGWGGTVVHHVLAATGRPAVLPRFRGWVRAGLWGLKDHLEAGARAAPPGAAAPRGARGSPG